MSLQRLLPRKSKPLNRNKLGVRIMGFDNKIELIKFTREKGHTKEGLITLRSAKNLAEALIDGGYVKLNKRFA